MTKLLKGAVLAAIGSGFFLYGINAHERVGTHPDYVNLPIRLLEQEASRLREQRDNLNVHHNNLNGNRVADVNTNELIAVQHGRMTLDSYVTNAKARAIIHLSHWINTDLMNVNNNFIAHTVANRAGGNFVNQNRRGGTPFVADARPADLTRNAFIDAMTAHINAVTEQQLTASDHRVAQPADDSIRSLTMLDSGFKHALQIELEDWIDNLLGGPGVAANNQFLDNAVANQGGTGGINLLIAAIQAPNGGNDANRPLSVSRDDFIGQMTRMLV